MTANPRKTMQQLTSFLDVLLQTKSRKTRLKVLLSQTKKSTPWSVLVELIELFYPTGQCDCPLIGIEHMLRLYFVQLCYNFSNEGTENALYGMPVLTRFVGIDLTSERVPDSKTLKNFRHLLEENHLARIFWIKSMPFSLTTGHGVRMSFGDYCALKLGNAAKLPIFQQKKRSNWISALL